ETALLQGAALKKLAGDLETARQEKTLAEEATVKAEMSKQQVETENASLRKELDRVNAKIEEFRKAKENHLKNLNAAQSAGANLAQKLEATTKQQQDSLATKTALSAKLETTKRENGRLNEEITKLERSLKEKDEEVTRLKKERDNRAEELETRSANQKVEREKIRLLEQSQVAIRDEIAKEQAGRTIAEKALEVALEKNKALEERIERLEKTLLDQQMHLQKKLRPLDPKTSPSHEKAQKLADEVLFKEGEEGLPTQRQELSEDLETFHKEHIAKAIQQATNSYIQKLQDLDKLYKNLQIHHKELQTHNTTDQEKIAKLSLEVESLRPLKRRIEEYEKTERNASLKILHLERQLREKTPTASEEMPSLQTHLSGATVKQLRQQNGRLSNQITKMQTELRLNNEDLDKAIKDALKARATMRKTVDALHRKQNELHGKQAELTIREEEVASVKIAHNQAVKALKDLHKEKATEIALLRKNYEQAEARLKAFKESAQEMFEKVVHERLEQVVKMRPDLEDLMINAGFLPKRASAS
ncbi:MAG: hypothetical protein AAGI90_04915, partial [Chlamydiota bacterium]